MVGVREWLRRLWGTAVRRRDDADLESELRGHVALTEDDLRRQGHSPAEAARLARVRAGGVAQAMEEVRDQRGLPRVDDVARTLRVTCRSWRRHPGFAASTVLVLGLGLGSATALFSAIDPILFRPLPYAEPDRLVSLGIVMPGPSGEPLPEFLPDLSYLHSWSSPPAPFESVTTSRGVEPCDVTEAPATRVRCGSVEANFLQVLGVRVQAGRDLTPEDDVRGAPPTALISDALWATRFERDADVIGATMSIDGERTEIVGVLPEDFAFPRDEADVLVPMRARPVDPEQPFVTMLTTLARLEPGVTPVQAEAATGGQLDVMLAQMPRTPFSSEPSWRVRSLRERLAGDTAETAWLLMMALAALLIIVCVNVSSLALARIEARRREFVVRAALGAGAGRLALLAVTETMALSLVAGVLGLLGAYLLLHLFRLVVPDGAPWLVEASVDGRVLAFGVALTVAAGLVVAAWPALAMRGVGGLRVAHTDLRSVRSHTRFALVTAQVALTVVMLGGAGLLLRSLANQVDVPLGFGQGPVVMLRAELNAATYPTGESQALYFEQLYQRALQLPAASIVALSSAPAPRGFTVAISGNIAVDGRDWDPDAVAGPVRRRRVTPEYFDLFRIPIVRGRGFLEIDRDAVEPAAILSESLASDLFGGAPAVGQLIRPQRDGAWHRVVGVAADVRNRDLVLEPQPELYAIRPRGADTFNNRMGILAVRTTGQIPTMQSRLAQLAADLDPTVPVTFETLDEQVAAITAQPRFLAWLAAAFAGLALAIAASGLYSVVSYLVSQRTHDIGVHMALGARPANVAWRLLRESGLWAGAGVVVGLGLAWAGRRFIEAQLFDLSPTDAAAWGGTLLVLAIMLGAAVWPNAHRAARVNPVDALRSE
jgi:predicted permease